MTQQIKPFTVTKALKQTLNTLNINYNRCFSDSRKNKQAVGVKFVKMDLTQDKVKMVVDIMQQKGYKFIRVTPKKDYGSNWANYYTGTRLTFYKQ